jgi:hypothetical protein
VCHLCCNSNPLNLALACSISQVLVDLVLQQEHHLSHLEQMKASVDADMANLDMLLSMDASVSDAAADATAAGSCNSCAAAEVVRSVGSLSTDSAAACSTGIASTPGSGGSNCSGVSGVAPALAQLQAGQQQQPQLQVQQWQHGSASAGSECGSESPMGANISTELGSNRQQHIQVRAGDSAWHAQPQTLFGCSAIGIQQCTRCLAFASCRTQLLAGQLLPLLQRTISSLTPCSMLLLATNAVPTPSNPMQSRGMTAACVAAMAVLQGLMQSATDIDWARTMTMSGPDWCAYEGRLVARLKIVLERREQKHQQLQQQGLACPEVVALPQTQRSAFAASVLNSDGAADIGLDPDVEMVALIDDFYTMVSDASCLGSSCV